MWAWMAATAEQLVPEPDRDAFVEAIRGNILFPAEAGHWAQAVYAPELVISHAAREVIQASGEEFFDFGRRALEKHGTDFRAVSQMVKQDTGLTGKPLFQPLRAALTGELDGPEMARLLPLIGDERARARLKQAMTGKI